jgi:PEGA domain-containing protein
LASHAKSLVPTGWSLRSWRASRAKRKLTPPAGIDSPLIFQDGFGTRWTGLDAESGEMVEILSFHPEFASAPGFAGAVGERVARLARVRHTFYARTRRLDRPSEDSLLLFSDRVPGWRLADVLSAIDKEKSPIDVGAVLAILRQLIPAVALFSRHQRDAAIGTVGPERLILTPQGRLVVAEYALAPGLETLQYSRDRLWRDLRVALPTSASPSRIPPSADVVGMGVVALSLLHARPLTEDEFLFSLADLAATAHEMTVDERRPLSAGFNNWLTRALQLDERQAFQSPQEAQVAFEEMLAKERGYVTTPGQLDLLVSRIERTVGPPVALPAPPPVPVAAGPAVVSLPQLAPAPPTPEPIAVERPAPVAVQPKPVEVARPAPAAAATPASTAPDRAGAPREAPLPASTSERLRRVSPFAAGVSALAVIEAGVIAWLLLGGTPVGSGQQGDVVIQSRPVAARVTIDGEEKGITPLTTSLSPGAHIVEVRVGRSEPRVIPMDVKEGVQNSVYVELQSVATVGGLDVRTEPGSAKVTVDGRPRGTTPLVLRDLAPGDHDVWLEVGRQKIHQTVRIEPGVTSQLVVPMGR